MEEHEPNCPHKALREYVSGLQYQYHICPDCHDKRVRANKDDFMECPNCKAVFSSSEVGGGEKPVQPMFRLDFGAHMMVLRLPYKGKGEFKDKEVIKSLSNLVREAIRRRAS